MQQDFNVCLTILKCYTWKGKIESICVELLYLDLSGLLLLMLSSRRKWSRTSITRFDNFFKLRGLMNLKNVFNIFRGNFLCVKIISYFYYDRKVSRGTTSSAKTQVKDVIGQDGKKRKLPAVEVFFSLIISSSVRKNIAN